MATVFISHPFSSNPDGSGVAVAAIARRLALDGHLPLAPQIYLPQFILEKDERVLTLWLCLRLVALSDEIRVYGEPSAGMHLEIAEARRLGVAVVAGDKGAGMAITREPPR